MNEDGSGRIIRYNGSTFTTDYAEAITYIETFKVILIHFNGVTFMLPLMDEAAFCGGIDNPSPCRMNEEFPGFLQ